MLRTTKKQPVNARPNVVVDPRWWTPVDRWAVDEAGRCVALLCRVYGRNGWYIYRADGSYFYRERTIAAALRRICWT